MKKDITVSFPSDKDAHSIVCDCGKQILLTEATEIELSDESGSKFFLVCVDCAVAIAENNGLPIVE